MAKKNNENNNGSEKKKETLPAKKDDKRPTTAKGKGASLETAASEKPEKKEKKPGNPDGLSAQIVTVVFCIAALLTAVFFIANLWDDPGPLIRGFSIAAYSLFGYGAIILVAAFAFLAIEWKKCVLRRNALYKFITIFIFLVFISAELHIISIMAGKVDITEFPEVFFVKNYVFSSVDEVIVGGGILGGFLGGVFYALMHGWVSLILLTILVVASLMFFFETTPRRLIRNISTLSRTLSETFAEAKAEKAAKKAEKEKRAEELRAEEERKAAEEEAKAKAKAEKEARERAEKEAQEKEEKERREKAEKEKAEKEAEAKKPDIDFDFDKPFTINGEEVDKKGEESKEGANSGKSQKDEKKEEKSSYYNFADNIPEVTSKEEDELYNREYDFDEDGGIDISDIFSPNAPVPEKYDDKKQPDTLDEDDGDDDEIIMPETSNGNNGGELPFDLDEDDDEEDSAAAILEELGVEIVPPKPEKPKYVFPPTTLLTKAEAAEPESRADIMKNAQKLVDVLKSFKVDADVVNVSCGPTITRYELAPRVGVRVKAIANLVDDIALNLETSGVRIEAPIPGKAAVGVEVPNKTQSTVYLRELIESEAFKNAKSKLTACLGVDVSGAPLLMDIAKMPHLLIAGATGMGKSVSVNSIIMSLLYKATPDELKLILVDPKKVELSVYNRLPHLLIPVVNNPKKAAGALATAVNEMERRFELIEAMGVRDIKGYNKAIENDSTKEFLPQIVIIIDELADLMLTAKDDVEDSICRIAQKARAAGIHLIICTQRPSVDVITGLIKANVPSRISFTVASIVDSRTVLDSAGAEKLIGRGDMLFAPVGAMKPIRAQGAFVSDKEVEEVTNFIKEQAKDVKYDDSFISQVEAEAERCGQSKKKLVSEDMDGDSELDPKFYDAVELAIEMGKISTSLLQRKLSLGYGRAAKIIDKMEAMNIVGPPEGQKPRDILISRQDFQEMVMRKSDG